MKKLEQIEELRKEFVRKIIEITGLSIVDIEVEVAFNNQGVNSELGIEARLLGWFPDKYNESAWYTNDIPKSGSVTVFVE